MYVRDIMVRDVISLRKNDLVTTAAKEMSKHGVSCVVIVDDMNFPIGIITERDITRKLVAKSKPYSTTKISAIMTSPVKTVKDNIDFMKASSIMKRNKIRRLPVVHNKKLIGIVTQTDILNATTRFIDRIAEDIKLAVSRLDS